MNKFQTHYDNLKVARTAPIEVIRAAYKSLSQKYHPDRNQNSAEANEIMRLINHAYEVLSDPIQRKRHDEWIAQQEQLHNHSQQYSKQPSPTYTTTYTQPNRKSKANFKSYQHRRKIAKIKSLINRLGVFVTVVIVILTIVKSNTNYLDQTWLNMKKSHATYQTSFDCKQTQALVEHLICHDINLATADIQLYEMIKIARSQSNNVTALNNYLRQEWNNRQQNCSDVSCLSTWYSKQEVLLDRVIKTGYMHLPKVPLPETGMISRSSFEGVAPFKVTVPLNQVHYFLKIVNANTGERIASYFIRSGETLETKLPLGNYKIKYAFGEVWYGKNHLFGENTQFAKANQNFEFNFNGYQYQGHRLELIQRQNGNLESSTISKNEF